MLGIANGSDNVNALSSSASTIAHFRSNIIAAAGMSLPNSKDPRHYNPSPSSVIQVYMQQKKIRSWINLEFLFQFLTNV